MPAFHPGLPAAQALGFSPNRISQFLKLARDLERLPPLKEAVVEGRLEWTKAQQVARVASPRTAAKWVDAAQGSSRRELASKVKAARLVPATATREEAILAAMGALLEGDKQREGRASDSEEDDRGQGGDGERTSKDNSRGEQNVLRRRNAATHYKVVLYRCGACKQTEVVTGTGRRPVDPAAAAAAIENAEICDRSQGSSRSCTSSRRQAVR